MFVDLGYFAYFWQLLSMTRSIKFDKDQCGLWAVVELFLWLTATSAGGMQIMDPVLVGSLCVGSYIVGISLFGVEMNQKNLRPIIQVQ